MPQLQVLGKIFHSKWEKDHLQYFTI